MTWVQVRALPHPDLLQGTPSFTVRSGKWASLTGLLREGRGTLSPPGRILPYCCAPERHLHVVPLAQAAGWAAEGVGGALTPGLLLGAGPVGPQGVGAPPIP